MHRITCISIIVGFLTVPAAAQTSLVNFSHVAHLTERIQLNGDSVDIIHIYADYPSYDWVDASNEGTACVDDAGRAAVAYLRNYELTKNDNSRARAKELLKFVLQLQAEDGLFYNFIYADRTINRSGITSYKSLGWWAARGVWSFGMGYRIYEKEDPQFALLLKRGIEKTFIHLDTLLQKYGTVKTTGGYTVPQWLLYESGSDATTELVLGLVEYYKTTNDSRVRRYIEQLCDGMMAMQDGDATHVPFGLHRSWETTWHAWGNGQTQVLAEAGRVLKNKRMIASAEREAEGFYSRLLIEGFRREFDLIDTSRHREFEQIAYDVRPMVVGMVWLYRATLDEKYLTLAKIAASWFFGNNAAGAVMYDPATGRCYDGIRGPGDFNRNSGAESTIEALMAIQEIELYAMTDNFMEIRKVNSGENGNFLYGIFSVGQNRLGLVLDKKQGILTIVRGKELAVFEKNMTK